jgi:hypothetical protein
VVDPAGTYVSGAFRSGDVAMRLLRPSWPLEVPCCYLETAKGPQHTYKSILGLGGDDLFSRPSLFIPSTRYENMPLVLVTQRSCNGGRSPISDFYHLCGDAIRPELTPLILHPPTAVRDHTLQ